MGKPLPPDRIPLNDDDYYLVDVDVFEPLGPQDCTTEFSEHISCSVTGSLLKAWMTGHPDCETTANSICPDLAELGLFQERITSITPVE